MSKIKNWIVTFCYKIHEKLRFQKANLKDTSFRLGHRTISRGLNRISGEIIKKIKKEQVCLNLYDLFCYEGF